MKKYLAILLAVALFAANSITVLANGYEDTNFPETVIDFGWWMPGMDREFDDLLDELVFRRFGEGFDFLFEYAAEIGQTFTVGQFEIEVVGAIAFEGRRFDMAVRRSPQELVWDAEAEEFNLPDPAYEIAEGNYVTEVESHVFVAIRDLSGELDVNGWANLALAVELNEFGFPQPTGFANHIQGVRESDRLYFAIEFHSGLEAVPQQVGISLDIEYFLADFVWEDDFAGIDFVALLESHDARFVAREAYRYIDGERLMLIDAQGFTAPLLGQVMGADFNPHSPGFEVMETGELNIRLAEGNYLTNIAITDDVLLRIQLMEAMHPASVAGIRTSVQLVDASVKTEQIALRDEMDALWAERMEEDFDWENVDDSWFWDRQAELDDAWVQELFFIDMSEWWDFEAPRISERGFFIGEPDLLGHLDFMVQTSFYETQVPLPFSFSGSVPVVGLGTAEFPGMHRVFVHDRYVGVTNLSVSPMGIRFDVHESAFLDELVVLGLINAFEMFEFELIMADGEVKQDLRPHTFSWSLPREGDDLATSLFNFNLIADPRELVGVRINGTEIGMGE